MSVRIFNKQRTRRLEAGQEFMILKPYSFADVPEKFTADITFQVAVKAGEIEVFETKAQGDTIEKKAFEGKPETEEKTETKRKTKKTEADAE